MELLILAAGVLAIVSPTFAEVQPGDSTLIEKDGVSKFHVDHSWIASIQLSGKHTCAGNIISERIILTAANCTVGHLPSDLTVMVDNSQYSFGDSAHKVIKMISHEGYKNSGGVNDVALMQVSPRIYVYGTHVSTIKMAEKNFLAVSGVNITNAGWRYMKQSEAMELRDFNVQLVKQCSQKISEGQICTSSLSPNEESCQDDIGSPLVMNNILVGVRVSGLPCNSSSSPGIYSDVSYYHDWIKQNVQALDTILVDEISAIHNHPWFASIEVNNNTICSGSIISKKIILTTSSCFDTDNSLSNYVVRVGSSRRGSGGSVHKINLIEKYNSYNLDKGFSDVALVKVSPDFKFGRNVSIINLAKKNDIVAPNTTVSYAGWANKGELMDANLRIVECKSRDNSSVSSGQICMMHKTLRHRSCRISAGSPLVLNNVQVAIVILDYSCIHVKFRGIYRNISYYRDWIDQNVEALESTPVGLNKISTIDKHPWLASIQSFDKPTCTGSIITKSIVLTAAQCFKSRSTFYITVRVGTSGFNYGGSLHKVIDMKRYGTRPSDLALLKVVPDFKFSSNVSIIKLARKSDVIVPDTTASIASWTSDHKLLDANLRIVKCKSINNFTISYEQICIAPIQLSRRNCELSSGSPLVANNVQVAVIMFNRYCNQSITQGVYSNISYYRDWIDQSVKELESIPIGTDEISTIDKHPWLVTLQNSGLPYCSGSIISKRIILTAAHCIEHRIISDITAKVGDSGFNSKGSLHKIVDVRRYGDSDPDYTESMHNIALLKVSTDFEFGKNVNKIDLASTVAPDTNVSYVGWTMNDELMNTNLRIVECKSTLNLKISNGLICMAPMMLSPRTCITSGGSPLVANNVLVAVMINGGDCHHDIHQGTYRNASYYRDWIDQNVKELDLIPDGIDKISTIEKYPWLATIQFYNESVCTGSIISERIVLTAAHCMDKVTRHDRTVRVGNSGYNDGGTVHNITDIQEQEISNSHTKDGIMKEGLVLLKVSPDFNFGRNVSKIDLASVVVPDTNVSYAGWTMNNELMYANLRIVECESIYNVTNSNEQICVAPINLSRRSCHNSGGSPLVSNNVQVAVIIYDRNCNINRPSGVYINVSHYHDWIEENSKILSSRSAR